jgi:hypothetical protein
MIAYNRTSLDNLSIRNQTREALAAGCITGEENTEINAAHPVNFYMPNIFICIGLFLLTALIAACSLGLLMLMSAASSGSFTVILIFFGLVCYGALEWVVYQKRHFKSGVDYALLWMSAGLLYAGIFFVVNNMSITFQCITVFMISILFVLRFANNVMALIAYTALLAFLVNMSTEITRTVQLIIPFILMAVSMGAWFLSVRLYNRNSTRHYHQCIKTIEIAALTSFYLAGNYFIVREMGSYILGPSQNPGDISIGWLFWILTVATPLFYIYQGIIKKEHLFLWTGLALMAAAVFTIRYYYHVMPVEWAFISGGIVMISIAYGLIKYLKTPRHAFTSLESSNRHLLENFHIESLVIAETFGGPAAVKTAPSDFQFGGGTGGGAGAGGQY